MSQQHLSKKKKALCVLIGVAGIFLIGFFLNLYLLPSSPIETPLNQNIANPSLDTTTTQEREFKPVVLRDFSETAPTSPPRRSSSGSGGSGSSGGSSSTPSTSTPAPTPPPAPPTSQQQPTLRFIREPTFESELIIGLNALTNEQSTNVFQFRVETNQPSVNFTALNFQVTFANAFDTATRYQVQNKLSFRVRKTNAQGGWDSISLRRAENYENDPNYILTFPGVNNVVNGDKFYLTMLNSPCELGSNTVRVTPLGPNSQLLFDASVPIQYTPQDHPIPVEPCITGHPTNPALWLRFEETTTAYRDSSGKENHINYLSPGVSQDVPVNCQAGKCLSFNGVTGFIQLPASGSLSFPDPISIEMNIYPERDNTWQGLISKGNGADNYDYHLALTPRNTLGFYTEQGSVWYEGTQTIPKNRWTHIVVTLGNCRSNPDGSRGGCTLKMFINGIEDQVRVGNGADPNAHPPATAVELGIPMDAVPITIGAWSGTSYSSRYYPYSGAIDEVVIYKRILTQNEIDQRLVHIGRV